MFGNLYTSFSIALQNVRRHLFHTLLSILGVVIGVAALVATLCLIDGVEKSIRETIADTISLQSITIESREYERVDGIRVKREEVAALTPGNLQLLVEDVDGINSARLENSLSARIHLVEGDTAGAEVYAAWQLDMDTSEDSLLAGRFLKSGEKENVAVVNKALADLFEIEPDSLVGNKIIIKNQGFMVIGVTDSESDENSAVQIPFSVLTNLQADLDPPEATLQAAKFEEVDRIKGEIETWLDDEFETGSDAFIVQSSKFLYAQMSKGMLFFKIFMGMITGISVIVGGVGIMNVLLISVKERTKEIGVRKATGARKKDIVLQFLSESITISALGSLLGLILGFLTAMGLAFIISQFAELPFQAAFTWSTFVVVGVVALLIGIIFGTYPAMKAARLTPVDAIRYE